MNMFKKNGGFTLVELIVVIAILAILAAVAVPAYSGYIAKANDAADSTALAAVKTAVMGALATTGTVTEITVNVNTTTGAIEGVAAKIGTTDYVLVAAADASEADQAADFDLYINTLPVLKGSYKTAGVAYWNGTTWDDAVPSAG